MIRVFAAVSMAFLLLGTSASFAQTKDTMTIKVFFHNEKLNPNQEDCRKVFPTKRTIPKTKAIARAALEELFKGTTEEERKNEFRSFEPEETKDIIKGLNVKSGVAYLNFKKNTIQTDSCDVKRHIVKKLLRI